MYIFNYFIIANVLNDDTYIYKKNVNKETT